MLLFSRDLAISRNMTTVEQLNHHIQDENNINNNHHQSQSHLENLPAELIQKIFLHSLEFNLPLASSRIAQVLSTPIIYTWLLRVAFCSDNNADSHEDIFTEDFLPAPLDFVSLSRSERQRLQTTILACRWCTLSLMRKCQREYVEHVIRRKCVNLLLPSDVSADMDAEKLLDPANLDRYFQNPDGCVSHRDGSWYTDLIESGMADLVIPARTNLPSRSTSTSTTTTPGRGGGGDRGNSQAVTISIWFNLGLVVIDHHYHHHHRRHHSCTPKKQNIFHFPASSDFLSGSYPFLIPAKLLRAPWTRSKLDFLDLLAWDGYLDKSESEDEENGASIPIPSRNPTQTRTRTLTRSTAVLNQLIRDRDANTFQTLSDMSIRTSKDTNRPRPWLVNIRHCAMVIKYARAEREPKIWQYEYDQSRETREEDGRTEGRGEVNNGYGYDPFARYLVQKRWDSLPLEQWKVKEALLELSGLKDLAM